MSQGPFILGWAKHFSIDFYSCNIVCLSFIPVSWNFKILNCISTEGLRPLLWVPWIFKYCYSTLVILFNNNNNNLLLGIIIRISAWSTEENRLSIISCSPFSRILIDSFEFVVFWLVNTSSNNNKTNHDMWGK